MQVCAIEAAQPDRPVPFNMQLPGSDETVPTLRLVALTGERVLNTFFASSTATSAPQLLQLAAAQRKLPVDTQPPSAKRARTSGAEVCAATDVTAGTAQAVAHIAAVIRGEAPRWLTVPAACELAATCQYYLAEELVNELPAYLTPIMEDAPFPQVR